MSPGGVNFSVYSRAASGVELLLFDHEDDAHPKRVIPLDPVANHTYHYWHVFVAGVQHGQIYGYRAHGPWDPASGMRFDPRKVLLDPYGRSVVVPKSYSREAAWRETDTAGTAMKSAVATADPIRSSPTTSQVSLIERAAIADRRPEAGRFTVWVGGCSRALRPWCFLRGRRPRTHARSRRLLRWPRCSARCGQRQTSGVTGSCRRAAGRRSRLRAASCRRFATHVRVQEAG